MMMERTMRKYHNDYSPEPGFGIGLPVGVILLSMMAITGYLVAFDASIPPPQTGVYLASEAAPAP
jgi:hypothetical protein